MKIISSPAPLLLLALGVVQAAHADSPTLRGSGGQRVLTMSGQDRDGMCRDHMLRNDAPLTITLYDSSSNTVTVNGQVYSLDGMSEWFVRTDDFQSLVNGQEQASSLSGSLLWRGIDANSGASIILMKDETGGIAFIQIQNGNTELSLLAMHGDDYPPGAFVIISAEDYDLNMMNSMFQYGEDEAYDATRAAGDSALDMLDQDGMLYDNTRGNNGGGRRRARTTSDAAGAAIDDQPEPSHNRKLQSCSSFTSIDVGIVYDSTFCAQVGGSEGAAQARVEAIVGLASQRYEVAGLCTTLRLSYLEGHCDPGSDIYQNVIDNPNLLDIFRNHFISDRQSVPRDVAHLFSGTDFSGDGVIGVAFTSTVCNPFAAYGINWMTFTNDINAQSLLFAHELGHNSGAPHFGSGNSGHIMNPSINNGQNGFSSSTINNINNYLGSQSCVATVSEGNDGDFEVIDDASDDNDSGRFCFSDRMMVDALGKGATRMDQLKVGDSVLTADGTYSKVYSFGHLDPLRKTEFLQIQTNDSKDLPLEITADHLLYVYNEESGEASLLPAGNVKNGDSLLTAQGLPAEDCFRSQGAASWHLRALHGCG